MICVAGVTLGAVVGAGLSPGFDDDDLPLPPPQPATAMTQTAKTATSHREDFPQEPRIAGA
jgi:hypothetical protein